MTIQLRGILKKFLARLPSVSRKHHDAERQRWERREKANRIEASHQVAELEALVDPLVKKLVKIEPTIGQSRRTRQYQLQVNVWFDPEIIRGIFIHGSNSLELDFVSDRIAHEVRRELHTINFARLRYEDWPESRYPTLQSLGGDPT